RDYVEGMWMMLQQEQPDDYVLATGETHSVREFVEAAFQLARLDPEKHLKVDSQLFRPSEVQVLVGDSTKAQTKLGWKAQRRFNEVVQEMLSADCAALGVPIT